MKNGLVYFISGGSGYLGTSICKYFLENKIPFEKMIIFSRDWLKQKKLKQLISIDNLDKFRFFIGDIRDKDRLIRAMKGVDICIHAAALKDLDVCEKNPSEAMLTNILGTQNIIDACIENKVYKSILISTDKACNPINTYGASKFMAEQLFLNASNYAASTSILFSVVRYGNVFGSSGSVLPVWLDLIKKGETKLPLTHANMTRFFIKVDESVCLILNTLEKMQGNELIIPKLKSFYIKDLASVLGYSTHEIGIRMNEKLHEELKPGVNSFNSEKMSFPELSEEVNIFKERYNK